jgi:hypothetical protein
MSVSIVANSIIRNFAIKFFLEVANYKTLNHCERMEAKSQSIDLVTVPGKKDDPNYSVVRGHVPNELYKKFKIFCVDRGVDNSEGLEQLLAEYFGGEESQPEKPAKGKQTGGAKGSSTAKRRGKAGGEG